MGLMDAVANGVGAATNAAAEYYGKSALAEDLARLDTEKHIRIEEHREQIRRSGRQADFEQDNANAPRKIATEVDRTKKVGAAESEVLAGRKRTESQIEREETLARGGDKTYLQAQRNLALAKHIVDPHISLTPLGDGTIMRVDTRSGKALGVLTDPGTGKPVMGKKDISESQLAIAKSLFTEGSEMMKGGDTEGGQAKMKQGRDILSGGAAPKAEAGGETKTVGGITYEKVDGGWKRKGAEAKPQASQPSGGLMDAPPKTTTAPQFNDAGYRDAAATIAGAERGDAQAKTLLQKMLDEGGLSAGERARAQKAIGA